MAKVAVGLSNGCLWHVACGMSGGYSCGRTSEVLRIRSGVVGSWVTSLDFDAGWSRIFCLNCR